MSYPEFLIDKRVVARNIDKGLVEADKLRELISNLPDVEANAEPCLPDREQIEAAKEAEEAAKAAEAAESNTTEPTATITTEVQVTTTVTVDASIPTSSEL